jgi:predicted metal-dependent enzyme (double-stranded beta helix superfamily)
VIETQILTDHLEIARDFARNPHRWPTQPRFDPVSRWFMCLSDEDDVQVWLLTWLPGQATDLHDHGGASGAIAVVKGSVLERVVTETPEDGLTESHQTLSAGGGRSFGPHHVHRIVNNGSEPAVTVHVYSPSLLSMTRYEVADGRLAVTAVDRAGDQW